MKKIVVKMPVAILREAVQIVGDVKKKYAEINAELSALPAIDPVRDGTSALEKRQELIADREAQKLTLSEQAEIKLKELEKRYAEAIDDQVFPRGADISGDHAGDYMLLHDGLIRSPEQLRRIADAHQTPAFMTAVEAYADRNNWNDEKEFSYVRADQTVRDVGLSMLNQCGIAVRKPTGYMADLVTTEGELTRRVTDAGISEEYAAGAY